MIAYATTARNLATSQPTVPTYPATTILPADVLVNVHSVPGHPTVALVVPPTTAHAPMAPNPTAEPSPFLPSVLQLPPQQNLSPTRVLKPTLLLSMTTLVLLNTALFKPFSFVVTMTIRQKSRR